MAVQDLLFREEGFAPNGCCSFRDPALIWLHLASDIAIALALLIIPAALAIVGRRRQDLNPHGVLYCFAAFLLLCAIAHLVGVLSLWLPVHALSTIVKVACAVVSIVTAALICKLLSHVLKAPSQSEIAGVNAELRRLNEELEQRVAERTAELSAASERLVGAVFEAREAERIKADFLARMSHELRTPLNAIIGFCEMMKAGIGGALSERQRDYCESIHTASLQLLDQIDDILDLEKLNEGTERLAPTRLDLAALCGDVVRLQRPLAEKARVSLTSNVRPGMQVWADRRALPTILSNLVSNALKYSPAGTAVSLRAEASDDGVRISVEDHGYGIDPKRLPRIFEPFYRAHEQELPAVGGSGLGLSLVKILVEAHGGRLAVESRLNQGTTVTLWLPAEGAVTAHEVGRAAPRLDGLSRDPIIA